LPIWEATLAHRRRENSRVPSHEDRTLTGTDIRVDNLDKVTDMSDPTRKLLVVTALSLGLTFVAGSAYANLCHNIGGPRQLGANCDQAGGSLKYLFENAPPIILGPRQYLGILIFSGPDHLPPNDQALAAHIKHGDGFADVIFAEPLHLASEVGPHKISNVECIGTRVNEQPPEPGNQLGRKRAVGQLGAQPLWLAPQQKSTTRRRKIPDRSR
jgi:hypothetical protein